MSEKKKEFRCECCYLSVVPCPASFDQHEVTCRTKPMQSEERRRERQGRSKRNRSPSTACVFERRVMRAETALFQTAWRNTTWLSLRKCVSTCRMLPTKALEGMHIHQPQVTWDHLHARTTNNTLFSWCDVQETVGRRGGDLKRVGKCVRANFLQRLQYGPLSVEKSRHKGQGPRDVSVQARDVSTEPLGHNDVEKERYRVSW